MPVLLDYLTELTDRLLAGRDAQRGTATAGDTTHLTCTAVFQSTLGLTSKHRGDWIYVIDVSATPDVGYEAIISSVNGTTGEITLDRTIHDVDNTDTFVLTGPFRPSVLINAINQVLRNSYTEQLFPLSSFILPNDDNDMESSLTSAWDATGAPSETLSKASSPVGPVSGALVLTTTNPVDAGEFIDLAADLPIHEGAQLLAHVFAAVASGDVRVDLWDATGAAVAGSLGTIDEQEWVDLTTTSAITMPTGCKAFNVRATSPSGGQFYLDDLAIEDMDKSTYPAPSWLTREAQLNSGGVFEIPYGISAPGGVGYRANVDGMRPIPWRTDVQQVRGTNRFRLEVDYPSGHRRYLVAKRPGVTLTAPTDEGYLPVDHVVEATAVLLKIAKESPYAAAPYLRDIRESSLRATIERPTVKAVARFG